VQEHTSGEVGILGTVLLRVYSGTAFAIFIEIGSYLTEKEQKISWHSFFETRCIIQYTAEYRNATDRYKQPFSVPGLLKIFFVTVTKLCMADTAKYKYIFFNLKLIQCVHSSQCKEVNNCLTSHTSLQQ